MAGYSVISMHMGCSTNIRGITAVSVPGASVQECRPPCKYLQRRNGSAVTLPQGGAKKFLSGTLPKGVFTSAEVEDCEVVRV